MCLWTEGCEKSMKESDEFDDDEIASEMARLSMLQGICNHLLNDFDNAKLIYEKLRQSNQFFVCVLSDKWVKGILNNNLYLLNRKAYNLHQTLEIHESLFSKDQQRVNPMSHFGRLGDRNDNESTQQMQWKALNNRVYYLLRAKQLLQTKHVVDEMKLQTPDWSTCEALVLLQVAHDIALHKYEKASVLLSQFIVNAKKQNHPYSIQSIQLLLQLLVKLRRFKEAIHVAHANEQLFTHPVIVLKLVDIARACGDEGLLNDTVDSLLKHWSQTKTPLSKNVLLELKLTKCQLLLRKGLAQDALALMKSVPEKDHLKVKAMNAIIAVHLLS
ncbi:hypothetical protein RFI_15659 [Reticulomyxa filosa]|uniref:Uncharacterized protein n=1 Tax=Reticulomyxa filosa TaxID=46433 RepID=X6N5I9_RETFI|nr:hypothetical protein RFI_15659 [Reticulomyxa filosa]|eukprot:ETO21545.1 hypothetical protein RFI_15659 [Reticulomyxa filosa]